MSEQGELASVLYYPLDDDLGYQRFRAGTFVRYLEEQYGADLIEKTWDQLRTERDPLQVLDNVLSAQGSSLGETYYDFALQYGYLREPKWLQKTLELGTKVPGPKTSRLIVRS